MKNLLPVFGILLSLRALAQGPDRSKEEKAREAVRADIYARASARKVFYQPGEFQTSSYTNPENNAAFAGGTLVVHRFRTRDSTNFVKSYHVSYVVTPAGEVYVLEVFNPRR
ncbi:hypothetical protein [Hymenobacter sp. YC55]|uniref:hypothetical protein n=1 Tax=Hymenobacter sp. YC55 TaxID=3034019 RepID=UPI0023F82192|nr:hypothetical protein [Hymenobacter sp. YC55]MDF7813793.1 hypothetical protein [Hymenobacter sp. YC55]